MDSVRKQTLIARRRLISQRFLGFLPWTLSNAFLVALLAIGLPKLIYLNVNPVLWLGGWIGGVACVALLTNICLTIVEGPTLSDAAIEIDKRFGLRERLSSALMLTTEDHQTEIGRALIDDANVRAEKIDIRDKFYWGFRRTLLVPLIPAFIGLLLHYLPNQSPGEGVQEVSRVDVTQVKNSTQPLLEQIKKKRLEAEKQGLTAAIDLFKKLEVELAKLQKDTKLDTKQTLAKLNEIKQQLDARRQELGSAESLKKNLQDLEKLEAGPAEKLAKALKQGDFEQAEQTLEKLVDQMRTGEMSPADAQQLQKQLEQLQKALSQAAEAHEDAKQNLQTKIRQAEAAGDSQQTAQLQRKLEQLQAQDAHAAMLQQMSDSLSQTQQAMQQGDMQAAQKALDQLASQLQHMSQSDSELQELNQLMDSISQCRSQMACQECMGNGCTSCLGGEIPGTGLGEGKGQGERPELETETGLFDSRVRQTMKPGETVYGGKAGGENRKGPTLAEVQNAVLSSLAEEPEPLDASPLPKHQRQHARDYFNTLRDGR